MCSLYGEKNLCSFEVRCGEVNTKSKRWKLHGKRMARNDKDALSMQPEKGAPVADARKWHAILL